ncbi:MAG: hypothetical protein KTR31_14395 [Myxococcales bacterium]|nr:hypothetical protein [Myxococcales bacterium]
MSGKNTGHDGGFGRQISFPDKSPTEMGEPSFEFETFAQSEADAAARAAPVAPEQVGGGAAEQRRILRRSYLPPGDVVVDARPVGNMTVVTLRGRINESFRGGELGRSLTGVVVFDLAEVDRVSSFGVKGWLQMLETARMSSCYFFRCSEAVINQITMMRNFCGPGRIHSLMVPYACSHCGEEFGALYESVADREYILGRSPAKVECPNCQLAAQMDDDPWSYFAIDEHLLDSVPLELQQVVDHLSSTNRIDPIEKFISEQETRIRFNAALDGRLRLRRAFAGLEGRVTLDLSVTPSVDPAGLHRLVGALRDLDAEVSEVWLDGAPTDLIRVLLTDPVQRVYVSSMFVDARCVANRINRPVLVDIDRRREVLKQQRLPPIEANWAVGPLDIADTDVLFRAAAELGPDYPTQRAPVGSPTVPSLSQPVLAPAGQPVSAGLMWQAAAVTAFMSLLGAVIVLFAVAWIIVTRTDLLSFSGDGAASGLGTSAMVEGWDGGSPLPPAWVDKSFAVTDERVVFVGRATGTDVDDAAFRSRRDAVYELVVNLRAEVQGRSAGSGLLDLPPDTDPEAVVSRFDAETSGMVDAERTQAAVKREGTDFTVVTQHTLPRDKWDELVEFYGSTVVFRGLAVSRRFPTDFGSGESGSTPLVVAGAESWFKDVSPTDGVFAVEGRPVTTLREFTDAARARWRQLKGPGGALRVQVFHDGQRTNVPFVRPADVVPPPPSKVEELMSLEEP